MASESRKVNFNIEYNELMQFYKRIFKCFKLCLQCEKQYSEIQNLKDVLLIDHEDLKTYNEAKNYKCIKETRSFT